ncbi:endonuclease/exonuclease/phosphatase family protein [Altererythrobacter sp. CAU 1778]
MQLTFASYNIHKAVGVDRRRDHDRIISVLREMDADVIALQEADRRVGERATVLPRAALDDTPWRPVPVARRPQSLGWHGNALLVRRSFRMIDHAAIVLPTLEPRGAVRVDLEVEGKRLRVIGTHLDLSGLRRRDQIRAILKHLEEIDGDLPTVLMGDFNQWGHGSGAMREFGKGWHSLVPGKSFPSRRPIACLDRIIASRHWKCGPAGVHHSGLSAQASDHLPVHAELTLHKK